MSSNYDGNAIIPCPFVSIQKEIERSDSGKIRKMVFLVTLRGKLVAHMGSPRSDGSWHTSSGYPADETISQDERLASFRSKIGALKKLFEVENKWFEIQPYDGSAPIKFRPRVRGIDFAEGNWVEYVDYTIQLETDKIWYGDIECSGISSSLVEESWQLEISDDSRKIYRLTHNVAAEGKTTYDIAGDVDEEGWEIARDLVIPNLGIDTAMFLAPNNAIPIPVGYTARNYNRTQQINELEGRFSVNETWILTVDDHQEEFNVNIRKGANDGLTTVSVDGTVTGYGPIDNTLTPAQYSEFKYNKANTYYGTLIATNNSALLTRAQNYSGVSLNPVPLQQSTGRNPISGVITYNIEFNNRAANVIANSLVEDVTITDDNPADIFARLVVLGRALGPILQPIGTVTESRRDISVNIQMPAWTYGASMPTPPDPTPLITPWVVVGAFKARDENSWNPRNGSYRKTISYTWSL